MPAGRPPKLPLGDCPADHPGPRRRGLCSACYQAKRRGPPTVRTVAPRVLLPGPRVSPTVAAVLGGVARRRGVTEGEIHREVLEAWADEHLEEGAEP